MTNYPEWALKYKKKGYYLNKYKDHYRLYKGHSEYRNGKSVRIVDYYCGTITEKDGLIPSKGLIKGEIKVFEYGFYYFLFLLFTNIYKGQNRMHKKYADTIMISAINNVFNVSNDILDYTSLRLLYPKYNNDYLNNDLVILETQRVSNMIRYEFDSKCSKIDNLKDILSTLHLIYINKRYQLSNCDNRVYKIFNDFNFEVKNYGED